MRSYLEPKRPDLGAGDHGDIREQLKRSWRLQRRHQRQLLPGNLAWDAVASLLIASGAGGLTANAEATPASANITIDGKPADCMVAPRPVDDFYQVDEESTDGLKTMQGTPIATPVSPTGGAPADPTTVAAIRATVNEMTACLNAGDLRRLAALLTDNQFRRQFGGVGAEVITSALGTPAPLPAAAQITGLTLSEVLVYPDGRVSAVATYDGASTRTIFVRTGDRYLADASSPATGSMEKIATPAG